MKKKPDLGKYFDLPNPGLRAYFERTERGNPDDYRPPFWKGMSREAVLSKWQKVFDTLGVKETLPGLYAFEMDMKSKVGPMSIQLPLKDRLGSIEAYYATPNAQPISQEAIRATCEFFGKIRGLRLRGREATIRNMRLSTNSGSPYFTKRRRVVDKPQGGYDYCAILGWRGQEGGIHDDDVKQRVVWMMPFDLNVRELQFYQPAIEAVQKHGLIPAYVSMDAVDQEVTRLFATKGSDDVVICTDFSKFDQHFGPVMQEAARAIESYLASNDATQQWFDEVYPIKFNIPLVCSPHLEFTGPHGMGSGSGGTNFDECLSHKALQFDAAQKQGKKLNPHSMAYGDDGILTYPGIKVEDVIQAYTSHGQEMNDQKQYVSKHDCVVLRRYHSIDYRDSAGTMVGVYSTFRALGRLLAQERFYDPEEWGPEQVTLRAWSILENCNHHPKFEQFVQFVMEGDKYRLGLDIPGFMDNIVKIASKSIDHLPDFLGYTKTQQREWTSVNNYTAISGGIKSWRIYQYLQEVRK